MHGGVEAAAAAVDQEEPVIDRIGDHRFEVLDSPRDVRCPGAHPVEPGGVESADTISVDICRVGARSELVGAPSSHHTRLVEGFGPSATRVNRQTVTLVSEEVEAVGCRRVSDQEVRVATYAWNRSDLGPCVGVDVVGDEAVLSGLNEDEA